MWIWQWKKEPRALKPGRLIFLVVDSILFIFHDQPVGLGHTFSIYSAPQAGPISILSAAQTAATRRTGGR